MTNSDSSTTSNIADTNNWDTVFAVKYGIVNSLLQKGWSNLSNSVRNFSQQQAPGYNIQGTFNSWQLTPGGDGQNVRLQCPISSGTFTTPQKSYNLSNASVVVEIQMQWVPDPSQRFFAVTSASVPGSAISTICDQLDRRNILPALNTAFSSNNSALNNPQVAIKKNGYSWIINDASGKSYYLFKLSDQKNNLYLNIYEFEKQWSVNLTALQNDPQSNNPIVSIVNIVNLPSIKSEIDNAVLSGLFDSWFIANLASFNQVFAALNISTSIDQSDLWKWMKPTDSSYAITDDGTLGNGVFGLLTMVNNNQDNDNHQVSPYAIPDSCDAGFLVSAEQFVSNVLLYGATTIFNGANASVFSISNDGMTISNSAPLIWGNFVVDNTVIYTENVDYSSQLNAGTIPPAVSSALQLSTQAIVSGSNGNWTISDGTSYYALEQNGTTFNIYNAIQISIDANSFTLTLLQDAITIQFTGIKYPASWNYDVTMNYTETLTLGLQNISGKQVFNFSNVSRNLSAEVGLSKSALTAELIGSIVTAVAGVIIGLAGPAMDALSASATVADEGASTGLSISEQGFLEALAQADPNDIEMAEADAAEGAEETASTFSNGKWTAFKNALSQPKYKIAAGIGGVLLGAAAGIAPITDSILSAQVSKQWNNVPGFEVFANQLIAPYSWPGLTSFNLQSAQINGSLQIGLKSKI